MIEPIIFKKEVKVTLGVQALKILAETKYTPEDFLNWALKDNGISYGGGNVTVFLEHMYNENNK